MARRLFRPLDRYVFGEFWRTFVVMALGFPVLVVVIDLTDNLDKYLNRDLPRSQIALSYLYWLPDSMFMVLPAAVLFATVFSIGGFTRHAEITAAKASGMRFHRLVRPIYLGAVLAAGLALVIGEIAPITNKRRFELLEERKANRGNERYNFAFAAEHGRVYKVAALSVSDGTLQGVEIERRGRTADYPTYFVTAEDGKWAPRQRRWMLAKGSMHILPADTTAFAFAFDSLRDTRLRETPTELVADPKNPQDMRYEELGRFIAALERSGGDAGELRVERALKIAVPVTCIIIALFGAPLATSTQRGGAAYGVGVSLATTVVFLMLIQLTKAIGGKGIMTPETAAWIPNAIFGMIGLVMLARVRT